MVYGKKSTRAVPYGSTFQMVKNGAETVVDKDSIELKKLMVKKKLEPRQHTYTNPGNMSLPNLARF